MKIKLDDLFEIIQILEHRMREVYGNEVEIPKDDYYWAMSDEDKYNPYEEPKELTLGQVSFDWDVLMEVKATEKSEDIVLISYHLGCLAEILNVVKKNGW